MHGFCIWIRDDSGLSGDATLSCGIIGCFSFDLRVFAIHRVIHFVNREVFSGESLRDDLDSGVTRVICGVMVRGVLGDSDELRFLLGMKVALQCGETCVSFRLVYINKGFLSFSKKV